MRCPRGLVQSQFISVTPNPLLAMWVAMRLAKRWGQPGRWIYRLDHLDKVANLKIIQVHDIEAAKAAGLTGPALGYATRLEEAVLVCNSASLDVRAAFSVPPEAYASDRRMYVGLLEFSAEQRSWPLCMRPSRGWLDATPHALLKRVVEFAAPQLVS